MSTHVFVYGTLLPDFDNEVARALRKASMDMGPATVQGRLYIAGGYPALVAAPQAKARVHGILYRLKDQNRFHVLDEYEDCDRGSPDVSTYIRRIVLARLHSGRFQQAWAYFYAKPIAGCVEIPSGCYRTWSMQTRNA